MHNIEWKKNDAESMHPIDYFDWKLEIDKIDY